MELLKKLRVLNSNTLKILAAIFMLIDHMALMFFPKIMWLRAVGRLSMPIFAFMIAEGCRYTKNKYKHFFLLFGVGAACQLVYIIFDPTTMYLGILLTFSISTLIIYAMQYMKKCFFPPQVNIDEMAVTCTDTDAPPSYKLQLLQQIVSVALVVSLIALAYSLTCFVQVDYGFWGIMMPVFASVFDFHRTNAPAKLKKLDCIPLRLLCMAIAEILLIPTSILPFAVQCHSFLAFILLLFYNGKKGRANLKYFFYIFYPLHLGLLEGLYIVLYLFN